MLQNKWQDQSDVNGAEIRVKPTDFFVILDYY